MSPWELKMTPLVGALTSLNNLLEERRYPCTVPKGDLSRGTLFFSWEWPRQSCPINTCKWQLHKLCGDTPQDDFVKQAQPKLPGRYTYGHTTDCFKALSLVLAGFASPCFIRQLSLFRAPTNVVVYRSDCRYLPYSLHSSEFMPNLFL